MCAWTNWNSKQKYTGHLWNLHSELPYDGTSFEILVLCWQHVPISYYVDTSFGMKTHSIHTMRTLIIVGGGIIVVGGKNHKI